MDSPLHAACIKDDVEALRTMLCGASSRSASDPDTVLGWTPLHYAAQFGRKLVVDLLLQPPVRAVRHARSPAQTRTHKQSMRG